MIYSNMNCSGSGIKKLSDLLLKDGDEFHNCNFSRFEPEDVSAYFTAKNILVVDCNCMNCDFGPDVTVKGGLRIKKSCCAHLHTGLSYTCADDCSHVVLTDIMSIDGQVTKCFHYQDTIIP